MQPIAFFVFLRPIVPWGDAMFLVLPIQQNHTHIRTRCLWFQFGEGSCISLDLTTGRLGLAGRRPRKAPESEESQGMQPGSRK